MSARPARVICVLGMHRSGTSALVGTLQQAGVELGEVSTWNPFNLRGNRENREVWELNERILVANGGSWEDPPAAVEWQPDHVSEAEAILAGHSQHAIWGFKDPRTLLTLEGWQRLVPDLELTGIFRDPSRVAQSLNIRSGMSREKALGLWQAYNRRLLETHRRSPFPLVCFDDEAPVLQAKLGEVAELLRLEWSPGEEPFFEEELRQAKDDGGPLPAEIEALHEELRALSL